MELNTNDIPDYNYGDFDYSVWPSNTEVTLCNVNWTTDYRDIVRFSTPQGINDHINAIPGSQKIVTTKVSYLRMNQSVRLDIPHNKALKYNYMRVSNPLMPITGDVKRDYYYFVVGVEYIAPNTTLFSLELDVWQTFNFDVQFGQCFVERSHLGIANSNQLAHNGRRFLTVPEGLDVGSDYQIKRIESRSFGSIRDNDAPNMNVLIFTTTSLDPGTNGFGDVNNPNLTTAKGSESEGLPSGAEMWIFKTVKNFTDWVSGMSDKPWIVQGIMGAYIIPDVEQFGWKLGSTIDPLNKARKVLTSPFDTIRETIMSNIRNTNLLPERFRHLKKFFTFPFCMIQLTGRNGNSLVIKPELLPSNDLFALFDLHITSSSPRLTARPWRYNAGDNAPVDEMDQFGVFRDFGEFMDMTLKLSDFPTVSIVNNNATLWLAQNRNNLNYSFQSSEWSRDKSLEGVKLSEATTGVSAFAMGAQTQNTLNTMQATNDQANRTTMLNAGVQGVGQIMTGNVLGVLQTAATTAINVDNANQQLAINKNSTSRSNEIATEALYSTSKLNQGYARYAANGDYENAIAGINAKVRDAALTQPSAVANMGGDGFNLARYQIGVDAVLKMVEPGMMHAIGNFWLRYGYAMNMFYIPPSNLKCMTHFTYWKMKETYIMSATVPEFFKQVIRGIFEKGVTVWHSPSYIGSIDLADNQPISGVYIPTD